jgi:hypothetical protein
LWATLAGLEIRRSTSLTALSLSKGNPQSAIRNPQWVD